MSLFNRKSIIYPVFLFLLIFCFSAESGWDPRKRKSGDGDGKSAAVEEAVAEFLKEDPSLEAFFDAAHAFAMFPSVGKGGIGIGGAYGKGEVYEQGVYIGRAKLKQFTIGFQLGGQKYREVIFFQNQRALDEFKQGNFELGAQVSAVAATAGASADADYDGDIAIFTMEIGGLMYEATVGGQKFNFYPK